MGRSDPPFERPDMRAVDDRGRPVDASDDIETAQQLSVQALKYAPWPTR